MLADPGKQPLAPFSNQQQQEKPLKQSQGYTPVLDSEKDKDDGILAHSPPVANPDPPTDVIKEAWANVWQKDTSQPISKSLGSSPPKRLSSPVSAISEFISPIVSSIASTASASTCAAVAAVASVASSTTSSLTSSPLSKSPQSSFLVDTQVLQDDTLEMRPPKAELDHAAFSEKRAKLLNLLTSTSLLVEAVRNPPPSSGLMRPSSVPTDNSLYRWQLPSKELCILKMDAKSIYSSTFVQSSCVAESSSEKEMDRQSLASHFIKSKMNDINAHLDRLHMRISDTRSRVLVTGDLNAGKSTFVNAMLRRQVVPDDQQPCTAVFVEVIDADQNGGIEEVHGISEPSKYKRQDPTSFTRFDIRHLRQVVEENEEGYELLKVYCRDQRERQASLLHNGVVDISLIDSPGLNIDSMKTTALFAQQEEIDVIVFVVNAENHFTLSGREFLQIAGREKAYIFIVVNRFDQIKRRAERCRTEILEQIRDISPKTYADKDNLVHFVSARQCLEETPENPSSVVDFMKLEDCLRSFILEKRSRSKLAPAKQYLENVLLDISQLAEFNAQMEMHAEESARVEMSEATPAYHELLTIKGRLDELESVVDATVQQLHARILSRLEDVIEHLEYEFEDVVEWQGVLYAFNYISTLIHTLDQHLQSHVEQSEHVARITALNALHAMDTLIAQCHDQALVDALNLKMDPIFITGLSPSEMTLRENQLSSRGRDIDSVLSINRERSRSRSPTRLSSSSNTRLLPTLMQQATVSMNRIEVEQPSSFFQDILSWIPYMGTPQTQQVTLFTKSDKVDLVKEFVPSLGCMLSGLLGYRGAFARLPLGSTLQWTRRLTSGALGKTLFIGMSIAGAGLFFYALSDIHHFVYRRIVSNVKSVLYQTHFSANTTDRIVKETQKGMSASLLDFRTRFIKSLQSSQTNIASIEDRMRLASKRRRYLEKISTDSVRLSDVLLNIDID